jgi:hypothetical protein
VIGERRNQQIGILPVFGEVARTGIGAATSGTLRLRHRLTGFRAGRSCRRENAAGSSGSQ